MSETRENYCKLLGLNPFKEDEYTEKQLADSISKAEAAWNKESKAANINTRQKYRNGEYLKAIPDIRTVMDSPVLRQEEFENARKILERKSSKIRREAIILHGGEVVIPPNATDKLAESLHWQGVDGKTLVQASGLKVSPFPRPINNSISTAYRLMADVGTGSPLELINRLLSIPSLDLSMGRLDASCSNDDLRRAYDTVGKRLNTMKSGRVEYHDAYVQAVRAVKSTISSDSSLEELNRYSRCMEVLEPAFEQMEEDSGTQFSRAYIDNLINDYVNNTDADPELCIKLLEDHCVRRRFPANFSEAESTLGTCPRCKSMIFTDDNCFFCPNCGSPINEICPCCGRAQTASNKNCIACGIDLKGAVDDAVGKENKILDLLKSGSTGEAIQALARLSDDYPSFDALPQIRLKVHETSNRMNEISDEVSTDFMSGNLFSLKRTVENGLVNFPDLLKNEDLAKRYDEACKKVSEADALCIEAAEKSGPESEELYIRASALCPDHPSTMAKLRNMPPEGPGDAEIECDGDGIQIRYAVPEDRRGMTFCIYRNSVSPPEVDQTTIPLEETEGWVFTDVTAEPGVEYFYRIYSKRWGVLSKEYTECGPGLLLREVTNTKIVPIDDGLKITYTKPLGCDRVRIWRKTPGTEKGDEDEILHDDTGTVIDDGLQSGTTYYYLFVAEYDVNGKTWRSLGTVTSGLTAELPAPIDDLTVSWDREHGCYVADWTGPDDAALYYSTAKESVPGEHVSAKDLATRMTRIEPLDSDDGKFRFTIPEATVTYICPAVTVGDTTIRGRECIIADLRPFRNMSQKVEDYHCRITMDWPEDAESAKVTVTGAGPDGLETSTESEVPRKEYEEKGFLDVPLEGSARTRITVAAVYNIDGKELCSVGRATEVLSGDWSKVRYTLSTEGVKGDRKKVRIVVRFSCEGRSNIPRCVMISADGFVPLKEKDGKIIWESDEPVALLDGTTEASFVTDRADADLRYMRLFFPDRKDYDRCRFVHPVYGRD